jgi:uncharacterized protein YvpB
MTRARRRTPTRCATLAIVAILLATAAACGSAGSRHTRAPRSQAAPAARTALSVETGSGRFAIPARVRQRIAVARSTAARSALAWLLTRHRSVHTAAATMTFRWGATDIVELLRAVRGYAASTRIEPALSAIHLHLPVIHQVWRNDCESAALSMMLDGKVSQERLQALLPKALPYLPDQNDAGETVWGNPNLGFVGPANGGGYGVYHGPLLALARRFDPGTTNLTGAPIGRIIAALQHARPIVAWIQLGRSYPVTWRTPAGATIHANWAEHAVTLTGWRPGQIMYNNPWTGTTETFTVPQFTAVWHTLGDQAIAGSSRF